MSTSTLLNPQPLQCGVLKVWPVGPRGPCSGTGCAVRFQHDFFQPVKLQASTELHCIPVSLYGEPRGDALFSLRELSSSQLEALF